MRGWYPDALVGKAEAQRWERAVLLLQVSGVQGTTTSRKEAFPSRGTAVHGLCLEEKNLHSLNPEVHQ